MIKGFSPGCIRSLSIGVASSLSAMALYFLISALWGEPLTATQQTLIIGLIVFLIFIPLALFMYQKGRDQLKSIFKDEIALEIKPAVESEARDSLEAHTGIVKIYDNFTVCEEEILSQLKSSANARIFLQMGKTVLSGTTNFYDYLGDANLEPNGKIRILHASVDSPYLSEKVAHERKSDFVDWQTDLEYATKKVLALARKNYLRLANRQHKEGYVWRLFLFDDVAYIQPYLYKRDNSERAPVIKVSRLFSSSSEHKVNDKSLYVAFANYFDLKWEEYRPSINRLVDLVPSEGVFAVAAVAKYAQFYVFGIPRRYILRAAKEVPFHGIGGKVSQGEPWPSALAREVTEEAGVTIELISSAKTRYITTGAELDPAILSDDPTPYCVYKRTREEDPNFSHTDVMCLVGYEGEIKISSVDQLKPRAEAGALLCLTGDMLRRTLHERISYADIKGADDGSRLILGRDVDFDLSRRAVPAGLATIVASHQRPRLANRL